MRSRERVEWLKGRWAAASRFTGIESVLSKLETYDGTGLSGGSDSGRSAPGHSDPTASAALARMDAARKCRSEVFQRMRAIEREENALLDLMDWAQSSFKGEGETGCDSCSRVKDSAGSPRWMAARWTKTSVDSRAHGPRLTTTTGHPRYVSLCQSCYDAIVKHDLRDLPPKEWVQLRDRGRPKSFNWAKYKAEHPTGPPAAPVPGDTLYKDWLVGEHAESFPTEHGGAA